MEDVTDIILNVKSLIVKAGRRRRQRTEDPSRQTRPVPITAGMIESDTTVTIVNTDLVLAR